MLDFILHYVSNVENLNDGIDCLVLMLMFELKCKHFPNYYTCFHFFNFNLLYIENHG